MNFWDKVNFCNSSLVYCSSTGDIHTRGFVESIQNWLFFIIKIFSGNWKKHFLIPIFFLVPYQPPTNQVEVTSTEIETSNELNLPCHISLPMVQFNNRKYNKNLISFTGVLVLFGIIVALFIPTIVSAQYGSISAEFIVMYFYILSCCLPVGLPTMYFMFEPKHFICVLKHFYCLWFSDWKLNKKKYLKLLIIYF